MLHKLIAIEQQVKVLLEESAKTRDYINTMRVNIELSLKTPTPMTVIIGGKFDVRHTPKIEQI